MNKTVEVEAETVEEAIGAALAELGVERSQVEVEVLEEPNKGLLGLRKAKAKVRATMIDGESAAKTVVEELLESMGVEAAVTTRHEDDQLWIDLSGDSLAWLIGHHGSTLDAVQVLVGAIAGRRMKMPVRATIDIEGYRARRTREVRALAERTIGKVLARREGLSLRPMSPQERKIVHLVASEYEGVVSMSTGDEPNRFVIITPAPQEPV